MEEWKDIKNYEGYYQVSNLGNIRSLDRITSHNRKIKGRNIKLYQNDNGYYICSLSKNGRTTKFLVHRLVAETFIPNPENKTQVNHILEIRKGGGNEASNLEWVSAKENINKKSSDSRASKNKKAIMVYTKMGKLVGLYESISQCSNELNLPSGNISKVLSGERNSCGGFIFKEQF